MAERRIPLKRLGTPDDMGQTVLFLASDVSQGCTAQEWIVDAGLI